MSRRSRSRYSNEEESPASVDQEEVGEITRCICGFDDLQIDSTMNEEEFDTGLFIQCEKCSVWQHGYCVGLKNEAEVPEKYYCEQCKPDLHTLVFKGNKSTSLYNPVNDRRKRRTPKKKEEIVEPVVPVKEKPPKKRVRGTLTSRDAEYELMLKKALEESAKESGMAVEPSDSEVVKNGSSEEKPEIPEIEPEKEEPEKKKKKVKKPSPANIHTSKNNSNNNSSSNIENGHVQASANNTKEDIDLLKPSKPRPVSAKSSMLDVQRRISAILEFITRTQIELANQSKERNDLVEYINDEELKFTNFKDSFEMMDDLSKKLINWEKNYGKFS